MIELLAYVISAIISLGYTVTAIVLLILLLTATAKRLIIKEWLTISNLLLLFSIGILLFQLTRTILPLFIDYKDGLEGDMVTINPPYGIFLWINSVITVMLFVLLLFKRFRQSVPVTVFALFTLNFEKVFLVIFDIFTDFGPSFRAVNIGLHKWTNSIFGFLIFNFLVALIFFGKRYFAGRVVKLN